MQEGAERCIICLGDAHHRHHLIPKSHGGHDSVLIPLCAMCHERYHRDPKRFRDLILERARVFGYVSDTTFHTAEAPDSDGWGR